jgi:hypothetical protein
MGMIDRIPIQYYAVGGKNVEELCKYRQILGKKSPENQHVKKATDKN